MKRPLILTVAALAMATQPTAAGAYEAATTHAGLTEQAAAHSALHKRLTDQFGRESGLFQPLIVPPADAGPLFVLLRRFNPTHGYVPDGRGRLSALGWLVAGSAIANSPAAHAAHHFFDPTTGRGLSDRTVRGADRTLRVLLEQRLTGIDVARSGRPATEWIVAKDNPMNVAAFLTQYDKAVRARTPGERDRHLAGALLAAGALLHVLQDMGSPSHVRNDLAAHLEQVGRGTLDVGSRFERIAALAYGRLGVPAPSATVTRANVLSFFTADDKLGLADITHRRWFSAGTLPRSIEIRGSLSSKRIAARLQSSVRRPSPAPPASLDLFAAAKGPVALTDRHGTCLARYRLDKSRLSWSTDDQCMLEQLAAIMPAVSAYSTGLLDHLFRGTLVVLARADGVTIAAGNTAFGAGKLELFWDDARGVRTRYAEVAVKGAGVGKALANAAAPPKGAVNVVGLFRGVDKAGADLVAAGFKRIAR